MASSPASPARPSRRCAASPGFHYHDAAAIDRRMALYTTTLENKHMAGYLQENQAAGRSKPVTAPALGAMRAAGQKITMLTCYDASFAALMDRCGVDMLLVGDSLGMVAQG